MAMSEQKPTIPNKRRQPILVRHAVSLGVFFVLALPISFYVGQAINQHLQLQKLTHADEAEFQEGLAYVYNHATDRRGVESEAVRLSVGIAPDRMAEVLLTLAAAHAEDESRVPERTVETIGPLFRKLSAGEAIGLFDALSATESIEPRLLSEMLLDNLPVKQDSDLIYAVDLLDARLLWSRDIVPTRLWVRWLTVLADSDALVTQFRAVQQLGQLPKELGDERIAQALEALAASEHDAVRAQVLKVCAGYAAYPGDPVPFEQIIFTLGEDKNPTIARRAWMVVGHLNPLSGYAVKWKEAAPPVAEAMLWAAARTNPDRPKIIWQALEYPATREASLIALGQLNDEESKGRFIEAAQPGEPELIEYTPREFVDYLMRTAQVPDHLFSLGLARCLDEPDGLSALSQKLVRMNQDAPKRLGFMLAALGGAKPTLIDGNIRRLLLDRPELSSDELHGMSDAELSELGLKRVDALKALLDAAQAAPASAGRHNEVKLLQLALWTRGDLGDDFTPRAEAMLFDKRLPTLTVLMCLLHKQRPVALDYLFGDAVQPSPDLHQLLVHQRYWHVFTRLVDAPGLSLWLWAKPSAQAFQLDAMRQWYAVNYWRIQGGWWPRLSTQAVD